MRKLTVYKNGDGYGPKRRPKLMPGDVRNLVSDDSTINKIIKAIQVPESKAGGRCKFCDLNAGSIDNGLTVVCLCNNDSLRTKRSPYPVSVCTLRPSGEYGGVFVVFKDLSKIMEDL